MATETVVPHHTSTTDEPVENKVNEEEKPMEQDTVSPPKKGEEEEHPKAEGSSCVATPLCKPEVEADDKKIDPPVVEVQKTDYAAVVDVPVEDKVVEKEEEEEQPVADSVKTQSEEQPTMESVAKEVEEQQVMESVEKMQEEQPKIIDVPKSSLEAIEKPGEPSEVLPVKESEEVVAKAVSTETENSEQLVPEVEVKPEGQSEISEKIGILPVEVETKCEEVEPKESMEGGTAKDEEPLADEIEDTTFLKEEKTCKEEEPSAITISEQVVSTNQQAQADPKKNGGETSVPDVAEKVGAEDEKKESSVADVVEILSKEAMFEMGKAGEENVVTKESVLPNKVEEVKSSIRSAEVTGRSFEVENSGKDFELLVENKPEESVKDEKPACVETRKDVHIEGKVVEGTTSVNEPVKESQQSEMEVKDEESEKEKVDETAKSEVPNLEPSTKDGDDTKTSQDLPKEIPAKPTQKQSKTIISKVKQSLAKAKKAIIGKSPSQTKGDIKVK